MTPDLPPPPSPPAFEISAPPVPVELPGETTLRVALPVERYAWFLQVEDYAIELDAWSGAAQRSAESWHLAALSSRADNDLLVYENDALRGTNTKLKRKLKLSQTGGLLVVGSALALGFGLGMVVAKN